MSVKQHKQKPVAYMTTNQNGQWSRSKTAHSYIQTAHSLVKNDHIMFALCFSYDLICGPF